MNFKKIVSLILACALIINPSASFASAKTLLATEKIENSKIKNNNSLKNHNEDEDNEDDNSTKTEKEEYKKHLEEIENLKKEIESLKKKAEKSANNSASADAELYSRTALIIVSKIILSVDLLHTLWKPLDGTFFFLDFLLSCWLSYKFFQLNKDAF